MDQPKPEVIEQEMAETRSSLVEKIAALETQVSATVQSATAAVQDTVQSVQSAVHDTTASVRQGLFGVQDGAKEAVHGLVDGVKEVFDVSKHTRENPWPMLGGAAAGGFLLGLLLPKRASLPAQMAEGSEYRPASGGGYPAPSYMASVQPAAAVPATPKPPGWFDELLQRAGKEVVKLGEQALSQAVAQAKTAIDQNVPRLVDTLVASGAERVGLADTAGRPAHPRHS